MKVKFYTLGCKVNYYETQKLKTEFKNAGFKIMETDNEADIFVLNSCTVTTRSDIKTKQVLKKARKHYKNAVIVLTGCLVSVNLERARKEFDADILVTNSQKPELVQIVENFITKNKVSRLEKCTAENELTTKARTRAFLKIQDGCNRYCSYCIIPYARGKNKFKTIETIEKEAIKLADLGYKEIVLVGINLFLFGQDTNYTICDAIDTVSAISQIRRIRLGSLEPEILSKQMICNLADRKKLCSHFHISLQSGCDKILKAMNRHYTTDEYAKMIKLLRTTFNNLAITTDIIIGFPGETEEDFRETIEFVKAQKFAKIHVFPYSKREGTVAASLSNQITKKQKLVRTKEMLKLSKLAQIEFNKSLVNTKQTVLFEKSFLNEKCYGYTENYIKVLVNSEKKLENTLCNVLIKDSDENVCYGILI